MKAKDFIVEGIYGGVRGWVNEELRENEMERVKSEEDRKGKLLQQKEQLKQVNAQRLEDYKSKKKLENETTIEGVKHDNKMAQISETNKGKKDIRDEAIGFDENGAPVYKKDYTPGMKLYEKGLSRSTTKEDKPEFKPGQALKEISSIDKAIGTLRAGQMLDEDTVGSLLDKMPELAPFMNTKKEMSPEDRKQTLASLAKYRRYLIQFVPDETEETPSQSADDPIATDIQSLLSK